MIPPRYAAVVLALLVPIAMTHAASVDRAQTERENPDESVIYNRTSGAVITFRELEGTAINLLGEDAEPVPGVPNVCMIIMAGCFTLRTPDGQDDVDGIVQCLCDSGCLTQKSHDSLQCGR